jgi:transcriptional regulator of heat shock response
MGLWSTALTALIAVPLAIISDRYIFPGKALLGALILIPMILPPFVGAIGVIGPTRMNYARIIPMVDYTAKVVGRILG